MDPANGVDIFEGFGAVLIAVVGGFVVFYSTAENAKIQGAFGKIC